MPAWWYECSGEKVAFCTRQGRTVYFLSGNNCQGTGWADIRVWWKEGLWGGGGQSSKWVGVFALRLTHHWWCRSCGKRLREVIGWVVRCGQGKPTVVYHHWNKISSSCGRVGVCRPGFATPGCHNSSRMFYSLFSLHQGVYPRGPTPRPSFGNLVKCLAHKARCYSFFFMVHLVVLPNLIVLNFLLDSTTVLPFGIVKVLCVGSRSELIFSIVQIGLLLYVLSLLICFFTFLLKI